LSSICGNDPVSGGAIEIVFDTERIADIKPAQQAQHHWISAGLIDLQVNGFCGFDLNASNIDSACVLQLARKLLSCGVTSFLPTLITAAEAQIDAALSAICAARREHALVRNMIPGIHLEGPYISAVDGPRGAHPATHVRAPDLQEFRRWQAICGDLISLVTLSPHWPQTPDFIQALCQQGVCVSIGHTDASNEQISRAVDAGASLSTHLGNGTSAMLPRHPNVIWSQLADVRLCATFIADGHHLPAETLKTMVRAKGMSRSILVSDVTAPGGLSPGVYEQNIGGKVRLEESGRLCIEGTPYLAGSARPLSDCVATAISLTDMSLSSALKLATVNPGKIAHKNGRLAIGEPADIIVFDWQPGDATLSIRSVISNGILIYSEPS